jgi:beta-galactosidase
MKDNLQHILYGGDYNPNQWQKEIWEEDMRLFDLAYINSATVNVFSWAKLHPTEEIKEYVDETNLITRNCLSRV